MIISDNYVGTCDSITAGCLLLGCHSEHNPTQPPARLFPASIVQGVCAIRLYLDLLTFVTDEVQTPKEHTRPRITPYSTVRGLPVQRLQHRAGDPRSLSYYQNTKQIAF